MWKSIALVWASGLKMKIIVYLLVLSFTGLLNAKVTYDLGVRMEVDSSFYDDDQNLYPNSDWDVRRFRFGIFTKFNQKYSAYFQSDFSDSGRTRKGATQAAWLRYRPNKHNEFYLGKMEMPFSLESVSNSKYHFFMERSIASALSERYGTGINYIHYGNDWNMRIGLFGDDHYDLGSSSFFGKALTGRFGKKIKIGNNKLYLGTSFQYRRPDTEIRIRTLPESHTFNSRLLDTGKLFFVNSIEKYGLEALWKKDSWSVQAEYIANKFSRDFAQKDLEYDGGYLIVSRIFNGRRRFSFRKGEWASTKVKKYRTWEISARYSYLDLYDKSLNAGYEENLSLGINYYLTSKNRLMFNYIQAKTTPNSFGIDQTLNIVQVRFQLEF